MDALTVPKRQGGSTMVVLPKTVLRAAGWEPPVPLRVVQRSNGLVLRPDPILQDVAKALWPHREKIHEALVYGSYIRNDWVRGESDIDILVIADEGVERDTRDGMNAVFLKHLVPISDQFYTPEQAEEMEGGHYFREVRRTGVPLWQR